MRATKEWQDRPNSAGFWYCAPFENQWCVRVLVTDTPASGRYSKALKMGGSAMTGGKPWSGLWHKCPNQDQHYPIYLGA